MNQQKKNARGRQRKHFPPSEPTPQSRPRPVSDAPPRRWGLIAMFLLITIGGTYLAMWMRPGPDVARLTYRVVNKYPHDPQAFTQGLLFADGKLYESTGQEGESTLREVDLETGEVLRQREMPPEIFAEGLALANDRFYQLTWRNNRIFVYDRDFNQLKVADYDRHGWGLTWDGKELIASDGTAALHFLDPETLKVNRSIRVRLDGRIAGNLNELEAHGPDVYANVFQSDDVYVISKATGNVDAVLSLAGLWPRAERKQSGAVLNGIAIDPESRRMWVTGKYSPWLWEIEIVPVE